MDFAEFRSRAVAEGLRYGEDRLVFLRELAQNSRDAGASEIRVTAALKGDALVVEFMDDGCGMSTEHAREYLFTLYASSKEGETRSAGRYGVGFWSVLLFEPERILIESLTDDGEGWAMAFDGALAEQRRLVCNLRRRGTRVELRRSVPSDRDPAQMVAELERALSRYCRHLRNNAKDAGPLPVSFNGARVDRPFTVDGPCWMRFVDGPVEGAVGLGRKPRVDLYARGLLVWRGATLDQLRYGARITDDAAHPAGLAPVYVLNGNNLGVTLDRRAVVDNKALALLRRVARRRMRELVGRYLDSVSPRPPAERLKDWFLGLMEEARLSVGPAPFIVLAVVAAAIISGVLASRAFPAAEERAAEVEPAAVQVVEEPGRVAAPLASVALGSGDDFDGPMVEPLGESSALALTYSPEDALLFRVAAVEDLHPGRGMISEAPLPAEIAPPFRCAADCVDVTVSVFAGPGILALPVPTGHKVEPSSVRLDGVALKPLMHTGKGEPVLSLTSEAAGRLSYRTGPAQEPISTTRWTELMTTPPRMRLPAAYSRIVADAALEPKLATRVTFVTDFVRRAVLYDRSAVTVRAYRDFLGAKPEAGWVEFVTTLARGDCDVKNALAVLMLRRAGVPARLAVGVVGEGGAAEDGMHAWVEYHDGGWIPVDATGGPATAAADNVASPDAGAADEAGSTGPAVQVPPNNNEPATVVETSPGPQTLAGVGEDTSPRSELIRTVAIAAGVVAGLLGLLAVILAVAGRRGRRQVNAPGGEDVRRKVVAQMLSSAQAKPEMWLKGSGLSSRKLLPLLGGKGKKMSLDEAAHRGGEGTLWHSGGRPGPVKRAVARGARILNSHDRAFGDIIVRLGGVVSLDEVFRLEPKRPEDLPEEHRGAGTFVESVDECLGLAGLPSMTVVLAPGLKDRLSRDVSLVGLPLGDRGGLPPRFVAVSPSHPDFVSRLELWRRDPELGVFLLLDLIVSRSALLRPRRERISRLAARRAVEESA